MVVLLSASAATSRDYQDSWILEGLEIPYIVFISTYMIYVLTENKIKWIIPFALIFRSVIVLLPNLKYVWFQGVAIDEHSHYRLVQDIYFEGHIPQPHISAGMLHSQDPLMHLSFSIYSVITGVPVLYSFKYWPIMAWFIYPLIIYLMMKNSGMKKKSSLKYALVISSIPVKAGLSYVVVGTLYGALFSFLFLSQLIKVLQKRDRRDWIIATIYSIALVTAHFYSSTMLIITLLVTYLMILSLRKFAHKHFTQLQWRTFSSTFLLTIILVNLVWIFHKATYMLDYISKLIAPYITRIMGLKVIMRQPIPERFFELSFTNFMEGINVFIVFYGGDIFLLLLTLIGILVIAKTPRMRSKSLVFLCLYVISSGLFLIPILILGIGRGNWMDRIARSLLTISPIFSCISLSFFDKKIRNTKLTIFIISTLMVLATIEVYGCQSLIPPASSISKDLPTDEPVTYVVDVNSVYQRRMVEHAERYIPQDTLIACDKLTKHQILGLTNYNFYGSHIAWYYPLDKSNPEREYDYFLIHLPGKSGRFQERAETRTRSLISEAIHDSNVVYTNGESYILTEPFMHFSNLSNPVRK